jgi:hypothetical protein
MVTSCILTVYLVGTKCFTYLTAYCVAVIYILDLTLWVGQFRQASVEIT